MKPLKACVLFVVGFEQKVVTKKVITALFLFFSDQEARFFFIFLLYKQLSFMQGPGGEAPLYIWLIIWYMEINVIGYSWEDKFLSYTLQSTHGGMHQQQPLPLQSTIAWSFSWLPETISWFCLWRSQLFWTFQLISMNVTWLWNCYIGFFCQ